VTRAGLAAWPAVFGVAIAGAARAQDTPAFDPAPTAHCLEAKLTGSQVLALEAHLGGNG
jgi:hypothetical protein